MGSCVNVRLACPVVRVHQLVSFGATAEIGTRLGDWHQLTFIKDCGSEHEPDFILNESIDPSRRDDTYNRALTHVLQYMGTSTPHTIADRELGHIKKNILRRG